MQILFSSKNSIFYNFHIGNDDNQLSNSELENTHNAADRIFKNVDLVRENRKCEKHSRQTAAK